MRNRRWLLLIVVLFGLLTLVYFRHTLFTATDAFVTRHLTTDLYEYFMNAHEDIEWLKQGFVPLGDYWVNRGGGIPAVPLEQLLVPSNLLLMAIYAITESIPVTLRIIMPMIYIATLITAYWFGTIILKRRDASVVLAVAYTFGMYGVIHLEHIDLTAAQPLVLLTLIFLEKMLASPRETRYMILTSVFLFMVYLTQLYPFYFITVFTGFRLAFHLLTSQRRLEVVRNVAKMSVIFLLMAIPYLLVQLHSVPSQEVREMLKSVLPALSIPPGAFLLRSTADVPTPEVGGPFYLGLSIMVLLLIPIILRRTNRVYVFYLLVALFSMAYAVGSHNPLNIAGWIQTNVPLSFFLRAIGRAMIIGHLGLAVCAAVGFILLVDKLKSHSYRLLFTCTIVALVFCDQALGYEPPTKSWSLTQNSAYDFLREQSGDFRAVEVPSVYLQMTAASTHSEHDVFSNTTWGHGFFDPQYTFLEIFNKHVRQEITAQEAAFYGVKYVVLNTNTDYYDDFYLALRYTECPTLAQVQEIVTYFSSDANYELVYDKDSYAIYENLLYRGTIFSDGATVKYERTNPNTVVIEIEAKKPNSVVVSQSYAEGWIATMEDGRNLPVQELNSVQRIEVPAGNYQIVLHYQRYERSILAGLAFYAALIIVVTSLWKRKALLVLLVYGVVLTIFSLTCYPYVSSLYQMALTCLGVALTLGSILILMPVRKR